MRREEFLRQLEYLLQDVPEEDKAEALLYYRDYLEEAGDENEEKAIADFGSPERIAAIIRADIMGNLEKGGEFTETGYGDERFRDPNYQVAKRCDLPEEKEPGAEYHETKKARYQERYTDSKTAEEYNHVKKEPWTSKPLKWFLWAILLLIASPFIFAAAAMAMAAVVTVISLAAALIFTVVCLTFAAFLVFVVLGVFGVVFLIDAQIEGLLLIGLSLLGLGCGIIGLVLTVFFVGVAIPFFWKGIVKCFGMLTGKKKRRAQHE